MTNGRVSGASRVRSTTILAAMYGTLFFIAAATAQDAGLRIIVLEGEDSVNIIERGTAVPTLVEVRDRNDLPVSGAAVLFLLGDGGTATLNAGLQQVEVITDALGRAAVEVHPIGSGPVELSVDATFAGQTVTTTIVQTNFATAAEAAAAAAGAGAGGGLGTGALVGIVGAAAGAVGAGVALAGGESSGPLPPFPPPPPPVANPPSRPLAPRVAAGDGRLEVSWSAPADNGAAITGYEVRYRRAGGSWERWAHEGTGTTTTITGLANDTSYEVEVRAVNSEGAGEWSEGATGTPAAAAAAPAAPLAPRVAAGDGRLEVSWSAPADNGAAITGYEVRYRRAGGSWERWAHEGTGTTTTITGLANDTSYEVEVRAVNSEGAGEWSEGATGTPAAAAAAPAAPLAPRVAAGDGRLEVSWSAPADNGAAITGYEVRYRLADAGESWRPWPHEGTGMTTTITGLANDTSYEVQVRASNSEGDGEWSDSATGTPEAPDDRAVLVEFYNAMDGENSFLQGSWNSSEPLDQWFGVDTDANGRVTSLDLFEVGLRGSIPSSLGNLTSLTHLNLAANSLTGTIPSSLGNLTNLTYLAIWGEFTGSIPSSLGRLTNLTYLELGAGNNPNHPLPIPSFLGNLTNLTYLAIWGEFTGLIPSSLGNLTNLTYLEFNYTEATGQIPSSLGNLTNLTRLRLYGNQLTGPIPRSLGNLTNLTDLRLDRNQLEGSIPAALCRFADTINPQQGDRDLPCEGNDNLNPLGTRLVSGDGQLEVHWTAPSADIAAADDYDVRYRVDAEVGAWTELPDVTNSTATSATITGLTNGTLYQVQVRAASAEGDGEWSATATGTPDVPTEGLSFGGARIEDQRYQQYAAIAPLELPVATGGVGAVTYALAAALPAGLAFDAASRTISGRPSVASAPVTYTYTAIEAGAASPERVSLSFAIEVEVSAAAAALRRDALAAQGRALLSSVTGVIGERFRSRPAANGGGTQAAGTPGALGALGESLVSMLGSRAGWGYGGAAGGAALAPGLQPQGHPGLGGGALGSFSAAGLSAAWGGPLAVGSASGRGGPSAFGSAGGWDGLSGMGGGGLGGTMPQGASEVGASGWDNLLWGRSFAAPLSAGGDGGGVSRYTVWGAGDLQSFSGSPAAGRYSGDVRSVYVGADGRIGADWLAGAAVGSSWGAADYAAASGGGAEGRLTTRLTSLYPYVRGNVSSGLEVWAIGGYGWGEARDARASEAPGAAGDLTMTMGAAGLRQDVLERAGVALAVVGGGGSLSLSTAGGGLTVAGLAARVHQARLAVEASRASGAVSPFVQLGMRYDGGDGQTGAGLEVVAGLRASTSRVDLEARGRWLSVHSAAGYGEYGASARLEVKSRPDGTGLRAALAPRWGAAESGGGFGQDGLLGGAGASSLGPGAAWMPGTQALSLDSELGYGWRTRRLRGVLSPMTSYSRSGYGGDLTRVGLSFLSGEEARRRNLKMQFTLGREQWRDRGAAYQLALLVSSTF